MSCEKWRSITQSQERKERSPKIKRKKTDQIRHILRRNCLVKHIIEKSEWKRGRGRSRRQLLHALKEKGRYKDLKEDALDRTVRITPFGRAMDLSKAEYGLNEWMNEWINESISQSISQSNQSLAIYTGRLPTDLTLLIEPNSDRNRISK